MPAPLNDRTVPIWAELREKKLGGKRVPNYELFDYFLYRYFRRFGRLFCGATERRIFEIADKRYAPNKAFTQSRISGLGHMTGYKIGDSFFAERSVPCNRFIADAGFPTIYGPVLDQAQQVVAKKHKDVEGVAKEILLMVYATQIIFRTKAKSSRLQVVTDDLDKWVRPGREQIKNMGARK